MALSTQSTGLTAESAAEQADLQNARDDAYSTLSGIAVDDPNWSTANAAALQSTINLRAFTPEYQPATYWDGDNQITEATYNELLITQASTGTDAPTEHVVGNVTVGRVTSEDPVVAQQLLTPEQIEADRAFLNPIDEQDDFLQNVSGTSDIDITANADILRAQEEAAAAQAEIARRKELAERTAQGQEIAEELNDWRVRLHLGESADYLYKSEEPGILQPLKETNGIIFPYTPTIAVQHTAAYENYDLVHSNYRGYFYQGSKVENLLITATFTANDVQEANYLLASMHFLRAATKMFYGQDTQRGMPPPVLFLTGLGEYQFNEHPCVITMMNYNLPNDVDYIPCGKVEGVEPFIPAKGATLDTRSSRLEAASLAKGGRNLSSEQIASLGNSKYARDTWGVYNGATYVPTTIEITFTMLPIQTRDQVSKEFSLKDYASGKLLKKGFW